MEIYHINDFVDILDPNAKMLGPVKNNSIITSKVPPGCWGPMITPSIRSGHEVTKPIAVEGAVPGDSIAIRVIDLNIKSLFTSSGLGVANEGRFINDPTINAICPNCNIINPETYIEGIGEESIKCHRCNKSIIPQTIKNGYTLIFDDSKKIGISVPYEVAKIIAKDPKTINSLPINSKQHPVSVLAKADVEGMITRIIPMIGNIGTIPNMEVPSSRNSGDALERLKDCEDYSKITKENLTDGHMDVNTVGKGSIIIVPVKVEGGGVYFGDIHSVQGNGELAGHTADVTADVTIEVNLIKNLLIEGPIIIPSPERLDRLYMPISKEEYLDSQHLAAKFKFDIQEKSFPIQFIGSGGNLNEAIDNAIDRAEIATGINQFELKNRATLTGSVDIGRTSGLVYITIMIPSSIIEKMKISKFVINQYKTI